MAKFRVETQLAIDKASTKAASEQMQVLTGSAMKLFAAMGGAGIAFSAFKKLRALIDDSIDASEKATAAQGRIDQALKDVFRTVGDQLAPGMNELARSMKVALDNPDIQGALKETGQLLSDMAIGMSEVIDSVGDLGGLTEAVRTLRSVVDVVGELEGAFGAFLHGSGPAMGAYLAQWWQRPDTAPIKDAYREHLEEVDEITAAVLRWGKGVQEQAKVEEKAAEARKRAHTEHLKALQTILDKVNPVAKAERETWEQILTLNQALKAGEIDVNTYQQALAFLTTELNNVKEAGQLVAETIATIELGPREIPELPTPNSGGSMDFGQSDFVKEMLAAEEQFTYNLTEGMGQAAASFAREFIETGELNIRRLGDMLVDVLLSAAQQYFARMIANQAALKMAGGESSGGGAATMGYAVGIAMVVQAWTNYLDHKKAQEAQDWTHNSVTGGINSGGGITIGGDVDRWNENEQRLSEALRGFLDAFQDVTGEFSTGLAAFGVEVRNDGKAFMATFNGEDISKYAFETLDEALIAGLQKALENSDFAAAMDPIMRGIVQTWTGTAEEMFAALELVGSITDEISGLSDIELAIRDLPGQASQLSNKLQDLGASMADANVLAAQWAATQYQAIRDQITGHQQSEAEQLAQRQREAAMFNAQLALDEAKVRAEMANLQNQITIEQAKVDVMNAGSQAQLAILNATMAAYGQVLAALQSVAPIDIGEIRLPNVGGGRPHGGGAASSGPSEAERRAEAFLAFLENLRLDSLSSYQRALADLEAAFAEQAQAAAEVEGGEEALAAARRQALADLREDVINAFGSPMEALRDRLAEIRQRVEDWYAANDALGDQFLAGEISLQQLMAALAESNQLWAEMGDAARSELLGLALYFADALGDTEESARIRAELAEMEWDFKRLEMQMLIETYEEIGWITEAAANHWRDVLNALPENAPTGAGGAGASSGGGSLAQAINRLRSAVESLRKSNEALLLSEVSPLSTSDQFAEAQRRYFETLAAAQGGDLGAMEEFAGVRDEYLQLAAAMFGTSGAGYQSIFQQSLQAGEDLAAAGQAILDAIPPQMAGVEDRLDTIAEILAAIAAAQAVVVTPPPPGGGTGGPLDPPRPPHWPDEGDPTPGGGPMGHPPRPGGGDDSAVQELRAVNAQLRDLLAATEEQTRANRSASMMRVSTTRGGGGISVRRGN